MLEQSMLFLLLKEHANVQALRNAYSNVLFNFNTLMYALKFQNILALRANNNNTTGISQVKIK